MTLNLNVLPVLKQLLNAAYLAALLHIAVQPQAVAHSRSSDAAVDVAAVDSSCPPHRCESSCDVSHLRPCADMTSVC